MKLARLFVVPAIACVLLAGGAITAAAHPLATSNYKLVTEPADAYQQIYTFIKSATKTLDMTMYELTDTTAESDLAADVTKGVAVRVILDTNLEKSNNTTAFNFLKAHGVSVVWANTTYAATHQKTITVDDNASAVLSGNLTSQFYSTSRDFAVIDTNQIDVNAIEKVFNADFAHTAITPTDGDNLVWSPTDSQTQLLGVINGATKTLQVENEEMGYATIVTALENAAKRGVSVHVIMTNTGNEYATEFNALVAAGVKVSTYTATASLYIHAKVILADFGATGAKVFVGSENFSSASLNKNRELGLILTDSAVLSSLNSTLTSDFNGATPWN